jgi:zinc protease
MSITSFEQAAGTPLCWFAAALRGGAALDPIGAEGLTRHAAELSRRGVRGLDRAALDAAVDGLGASLDLEIDRDSTVLTGMCLARNLDRLVELAARVLAEPTMAEDEHERLLRETHHELDDLRDDDASLADRFFNVHCAPGHPYGRTTIGSDATLAAMTVDSARQQLARVVSADRMVLGFAGALDRDRAEVAAARLEAAVASQHAPPSPEQHEVATPPGVRIIVVDKPERGQCQMLLGHTAPRYGSDDFVALVPVETAFGGMFSSRLMQEVRVARGWSYGAGCRMHRGQLGHWFRMHLAPTAEVAADALALVIDLYRRLVDGGITADELAFAKSYLVGSLAFSQQTARQRMRLAVQHAIFGLPSSYVSTMPDRLEAITLDATRAATERWLSADRLCCVVVATADQLVPRLEAVGLTPTAVLSHDSY